MEKKHIISLAGDLASGKGETSKILTQKLGYGIYRNGQYFRELAKKMNMSVTEFNVYVEAHPEIDRQIENSAAEYAKNNDNFIIDARLGWYAVPESFKVYLTVDIDVAAKRAFQDNERKDTENFVCAFDIALRIYIFLRIFRRRKRKNKKQRERKRKTGNTNAERRSEL